ncbi:MAG TPA: helix-turn-helix domain-containing protein [Candidatus Kapabacteria bacterium]|nr:helix-turn-helix domain-containing protein [Candidatus Kapabacteria bacterium]HPO62509.1 helix-turn-helix domain-containing protein [Candidatus Kapabacteria bacterium]
MINLTIKPNKFLEQYIDYYWVFETERYQNIDSQLVYPLGNMEMMFHYGTPFLYSKNESEYIKQPDALLCCQKLSSINVIPAGKIGMIAVYFKPFGASLFFDLSYSELNNTNLDLGAIIGDKYKTTREKLGMASNLNKRIAIIENFLLNHYNNKRYYEIEILSKCIEIIDTNFGMISIDDLANETCITNKQLDRYFNKRIGLAPKQYIRIKKINYAIAMLRTKRQMNLTQIALETGFYDQAHFTNDFKKITGINPKKFSALLSEK